MSKGLFGLLAICLLLPLSCYAHKGEREWRKISELKGCSDTTTKFVGYIHSDRKNAWLTDGPGINERGLLVEVSSELSKSKSNEIFFNYIYRPKMFMNNTLRGTFDGMIQCNKNGVPVLKVKTIRGLILKPIK